VNGTHNPGVHSPGMQRTLDALRLILVLGALVTLLGVAADLGGKSYKTRVAHHTSTPACQIPKAEGPLWCGP
jgi:hypothetical protein